MKYNVTSAEASKLLKKIMDEKNIALNNERQSSTFNASLAEDIESIRPDYNYEETKKYLKENPDITAIFAISDFMATGVAKAICDLGLKIGKDISVVGFDGMDISEFYNPGITTVKQPKREIALKSIELLFDLLKGECENKHLVLETELIERESCGNIIK